MRGADRFDGTIFLRVLTGVLLGSAVGVVLLLWVIPNAVDYRPAVLSTIVVPLGCFGGWVISPSRERAPTAALACFGLYFLSAFVAARLGTIAPWNYFPTVVGVQTAAAAGLAVLLGFLGRGSPQVEKLRAAGDLAALASLVRQGGLPERLEAVRALSVLGQEQARPVLLAALNDEDGLLRREALSALVGLATEADVPRLEALLGEPDPSVRRRALRVLRWIEGDAARQALRAYRRRATK